MRQTNFLLPMSFKVHVSIMKMKLYSQGDNITFRKRVLKLTFNLCTYCHIVEIPTVYYGTDTMCDVFPGCHV